jgi:Mn2+/Fe2+ NRAMP family transporter
MTVLIVVQQGGIVAGVAQSLAAGLPLTRAGAEWNEVHDEIAAARIAEAAARRTGDDLGAREARARLAAVEATQLTLATPVDTACWCVVVGAVAAALLGVGRYAVLERLSIGLVIVFVAVTLAAVVLLQFDATWAISGRELAGGLVPSLPPPRAGRSPLPTALAAFGIIGVGASELMFYPYWCLAKGYGRAVGPRDESPAWAARARGWMRVLAVDAWASMVVYTVVTVAFYLLGAATLGRIGLIPAGGEMVRSLGAMYVPVFGPLAGEVFLVGACAVLFSTLVAAADGNSRIVADGLVLAGLLPDDEASRAAWGRRIAVAWIVLALALALVIREPVGMVLASGLAQAVMLAAIGAAVLHFRHREGDPRLAPGRAWDAILWLSAAALIAVGAWTAWQQVVRLCDWVTG